MRTFGKFENLLEPKMTHTILFNSFASNLGTRVLGQEIRVQIEQLLESNDFVIFDFKGVDFVSHSFSDECFGKLLLKFPFPELKSKSTFVNASELVKKTIALAINDRLKASLAY
ncbi:STAS-like domain-containing protein [uncultured Algoriphagus sp.]|uniref:STAS-like domain-containing protein n=1 Tax=uncultured Algoriphagus sp. TaxID=417365 RepID=UPI0030EB7DB6